MSGLKTIQVSDSDLQNPNDYRNFYFMQKSEKRNYQKQNRRQTNEKNLWGWQLILAKGFILRILFTHIADFA
jgi:hypothetical protein